MLQLLLLVSGGILAKYVYTISFSIGPMQDISLNLVALPAIIASMVLGPVYGAIVGGSVDLLGHVLHPAGDYIPLITVMAIVRGLVPGLMFNRLRGMNTLQSVLLAITISQLITSVGLASFILAPYFGQTVGELMLSRLVSQHFIVFLATAIVYPIIDHAQSVVKIKAGQERFRTLIDTIPEAVFRCNLDNHWTMQYISDVIADMTGYPPSDFIDNAVRTFASIIHPQDREFVEKTIINKIAAGKPYEAKYRLRTADKGYHWVSEVGQAVYNDKGEAVAVDGVITDINEIVEAEKALRESEAKYRSIIEVMPDIIVRSNGAGEYLDIYVSSDNESLLVKPKEQLIGQRIIDMLPEKQGQLFMDGILEALAQRKLHTIEYHLDQTQRTNWFEARLLPITGEELVILIRDITKRKQAEQNAADYLQEVETQRDELNELYRRLDEEMAMAREVHSRLLQKTIPQIPRLHIAAYNKPATYIGGDFYGVIQKGDRLLMYLSDATGHGLDGTLFSTFVKNTIGVFVDLNSEASILPENILAYLNTRIRVEEYPSEYAIALFILVLDLKEYHIWYSGVGFQNPPLLMVKDQPPIHLMSAGLPISPDVPIDCMDFASSKKKLETPFCLFLATDGLYEQRSHDGVYEPRLVSLVETFPSTDVEKLCAAIQEDFQDFLGSWEQEDDVTYLILGCVDDDS